MTSQTPLLPYVKFPANLPPLPVRRDDDSGGPVYVTNTAITHESAQGLTLSGTTQTGATVTIRIAIITPGIAHVVLEDTASDPDRVTLARNVSGQSVRFSLEKAEGQIKLLSDDITIEIDLNPFRIAFSKPDGHLLLSQNYTDCDVTDRFTFWF